MMCFCCGDGVLNMLDVCDGRLEGSDVGDVV